MTQNPLKVIKKEPSLINEGSLKKQTSKRDTTKAFFENKWLKNPNKFNPLYTAEGRLRLERTFKLIKDEIDISQKKIADLGCGSGVFSRQLRDAGAIVDAVDISQNALKLLKKEDCKNITPIQDYVPKLLLNDDAYDVVVATDLIAHLDKSDFRIFFSELSRIVQHEGYIVCSTPIDIYSEGALQQFAELAQTEFDIIKWQFSYHYLHILICNFFKAPEKFAKASKNQIYKKTTLEKRYSINRFWFRINSCKTLGYLWSYIKFLTTPIQKYLENNIKLTLFLEKTSKFFWKESGISHAIFIAKKRALLPSLQKETQPKEMKHKKQVWE